MSYLTILVLAFGLSFDSFAVSVTSGLSQPQIRFSQATKFATIFAVTQSFMPMAGMLLENYVRQFTEPVNHWIAFCVLSAIGGKMVLESLFFPETRSMKDPLKIHVAVFLAIATSMDALAVGFSVSLLINNMFLSVLIIGIVTFLASMTGIFIGKKTGPRINCYAEVAGGLILLFVGLKILLEHLLA